MDLSKEIPSDSTLRYQLLHRTVSAILEAQLHSAVAAVILVHAFGPEAAGNLSDFSDFLRELGGRGLRKGEVSGPHQLGEYRDSPCYLLWWPEVVISEAA